MSQSNRKYGRGKFAAHPEYVKYMGDIVDHKNYAGMPNARSADGHINWQVSTGKTTSFHEYYDRRFQWWVKKADKLGLPGTGNTNERFSIAARKIHPTGYRPCRLCGKNWNVGYFYLNDSLAKAWNNKFKKLEFSKGLSISEALQQLKSALSKAEVDSLVLETFPERKSFFDEYGFTKTAFEKSNFVRSNRLSPGYMCNPPDRLDGFHDYDVICRKANDPGRFDLNMRSYIHDRRTFEWWAEGNWFLADALYNSAGPPSVSI